MRVPAPRPRHGRPDDHAADGLLSPALDQRLERGLIADRIEVRILLGVRPTPVRTVDREPEVIDRVTRPAREALATGEVVEQPGVLRMSLDEFASAIGRLG